MLHQRFNAVRVAIVLALAVMASKSFAQQAGYQDECDQWTRSHAHDNGQMKMEEDGMRSMFMLNAQTLPTPVVCLVRFDPFRPPGYQGIGTATRKVPGGQSVQDYFNQGLQFYYAFNNRESYRASRYAASIATKGCAMCYVAQALALGPDINMGRENEPDRKAANQALADAGAALQVDFTKGGISREERDEIDTIIQALKLRFANCPSGSDCQAWRNDQYQQAIAAQFSRYKSDPDYVILFADAAMNRTPWGYWNPDGSPKNEAIKQSQQALEEALNRNPRHNGLVHWYIHLMEMSGTPQSAEPYASTLASLAPKAGHLVHMPSHIYYRLGKMKNSIEANRNAVITDKNYFDHDDVHHPRPDGDRYRFGYYPHNIHFQLASAVLIGQRTTVEEAARKLWDSAPSKANGYRADRYRAVYYLARLNFASHAEIKGFTAPADGQFFAGVAYYYAQLVADIVPFNTGRAQADYQKLEENAQKYRENAQDKDNLECDPSKKLPGDVSLCVIRIMSRLSQARIAAADFRDPQEILNLTDDAARTQRALPYDEPPAWMYPVDQTFAGLMLSRYVSKRPQARSYLELAKKSLEDSLQEKQPLPSGVFLENAWAYFGLWQLSEKLGLKDDAQKYEKKFRDLWQDNRDPGYLQM